MIAEINVKVTSQYASSNSSGKDLHSSCRKVATALLFAGLIVYYSSYVSLGVVERVKIETSTKDDLPACLR